ncbi:MAG TPA: apolipoprotein N-acyltransferase, partial [Verrucomicrobiae bacterium]|nr:apolipoprotein N-acyltransferase [Verrucomicrobiae bacterium]
LNIAMVRFGKLPLPVSVPLALLLAAYLALFPALLMYLVRRGELRGVTPLASFPVLWVALEYLRSFLLTGFPWASLGYSQSQVLPLIQIADVTGIYGVGFLLALSNVVLYRVVRAAARRGEYPFPLKSLVLLCLLVAGSLLYGYRALRLPEEGAPLRVALVQGNIDQGVKWDPSYRDATIETYSRLSRKACASGADLVVWPESAAPFFFQHEAGPAERIRGLARETGTCILFGSPAAEQRNGGTKYLNSAFLLSPGGEVLGRSDKMHLVPFGEYVPMARFLPFVNKLVQGIGDFAPASQIATLDTGKGSIGVLICFEGIFPELARGYARAGSSLLVNITNDAWYGESSAPWQHLAMTVFRAVETRLPLVRAANTGITAVIDSRGRVLEQTQLFTEAVVNAGVRLPAPHATFYTRYGDLFALTLTGFAVLLSAVALFGKKRKS